MPSQVTQNASRTPRPLIALTLRVANGAAAQQATLDAWLDEPAERATRSDETRRVVIAQTAFSDLQAPLAVVVVRLAAGCVCCVGQLPLRVTLTRVIRQRPDAILLLLANEQHASEVRPLLQTWSGALHLV